MNLFFHIGFGGFHGGRGGLIRFGRGFIDDFFSELVEGYDGNKLKRTLEKSKFQHHDFLTSTNLSAQVKVSALFPTLFRLHIS